MLCRQISIKNTSPRSVTVCFPVISISSTSLKENSNPKYLNVMINPFSVSPRQKCSSLIPHLQKLIIHNTSLAVLWQIVSLTVKESFLVFLLHPSLMPCLLYLPSLMPCLFVSSTHITSPYQSFLTILLWNILARFNRPLSFWVPHSVHLHFIINVRITSIPSKLSHLTKKMARTSQSNPINGSRSVISRLQRYQILEKKRSIAATPPTLSQNWSKTRSRPPPPMMMLSLHSGNISSSSLDGMG